MAEHDPVSLDLSQLRQVLASEGQPWHSAPNSMTVLSEGDRRQRLGVPLPDSQDEIDALLAQAEARVQSPDAIAVGAPASFDARNVGGANYVTPVKDQRNCGSCVAFGTVATIETTASFTRRQPGMVLDLSEQHLFFVLGLATGASCANGWWPEHALTAARNTGVTFEDYMPYKPDGSGTLNADWQNRLGQVTAFRNLTGNVAAMKEHLAAHGAITACMIVYQDFFSYGSGVYRHVSGGQAGGHCVVVVGYDDGQGCWIAKNSWGSAWGDGGFFRIAYGQCAIETWNVWGVDAVALRRSLPAAKLLGLWSNDAPNNNWAYVQNTGWLRVAPLNAQTSGDMLALAGSAHGAGRTASMFEDRGTLTVIYA